MKSRMIVAVVLAFLLSGCATGIKRIGYTNIDSNEAANLEGCEVVVKYRAGYKDQDIEVLGSIRSYDTGFSVNCGAISVLTVFMKDACAQGADIVNIKEEKFPDLWSTCYRATADLIRLKDRDAVKSLVSDGRYSFENLTRREEREAKERSNRAIEAGIMGGIIGGMSVAH